MECIIQRATSRPIPYMAYAHSRVASSWRSGGRRNRTCRGWYGAGSSTHRRVALRRDAKIVAIGTVATRFLCRIQTELGQSIAVFAVSMLGVLGQIPLHARFGF